MIDNVNQFIGTLADTEFARTARRSARTIWNAHRAALETTRVEAGKVFFLAIDEGQKLATRAKPAARKTVSKKSTRRSTRRAA
jgi:hypothetical protein